MREALWQVSGRSREEGDNSGTEGWEFKASDTERKLRYRVQSRQQQEQIADLAGAGREGSLQSSARIWGSRRGWAAIRAALKSPQMTARRVRTGRRGAGGAGIKARRAMRPAFAQGWANLQLQPHNPRCSPLFAQG